MIEASSMRPVLGIAVFIGVACVLSRNRHKIPWRIVVIGLILQFMLSAFFMHVQPAQTILSGVTIIATILEQATREGTQFVFGYIGGGPLPFIANPDISTFILAIHVLPVIIVIGALSALLWHWKILTMIVKVGGWLLHRLLNVQGAAGLAAFANIFLSMIEAPLLIKPYLARMPKAELFVVMAAGMATVAGGTAIVIKGILAGQPDIFANVIIASMMNVLSVIVVSACLFPDGFRGKSGTIAEIKSPFSSSMDALISGTSDGVRILVNVIAMLIVFIAIVAVVNMILGALPGDWSLQRILGHLFMPVAWLLGIPEEELLNVGYLLGVKIAVNEIVAYSFLADFTAVLSPYSVFVMTFALCGFGNIGSMAIIIGGLTAMVPERKQDIIRLAPWSLLAAFLANCITAATAALTGT